MGITSKRKRDGKNVEHIYIPLALTLHARGSKHILLHLRDASLTTK
jgi:hypothetical protein